MWNDKKIIVSMTSYPKRINNVHLSAYLLSKQTIIPDEIYLWLSEDEFPNKENDLPKKLQTLIELDYITLRWTSYNTYCFKRHNIFTEIQNPFYCFFIDDDVKYTSNLIESTLKLHDTHPNCMINYTNYGKILYKNKHQLSSANSIAYPYPTPNNRWCGQCMIPSWIYPMEMFLQENIQLRDKLCPVCDETWITQFLIKNNIPVFNNNLPWGKELNSTNGNKIGIINKVKQLDKNGLNFRDRCLIEIFKSFPENKQYYIEHFNY